MTPTPIFISLQKLCDQLVSEFESIPSERKAKLDSLSDYFAKKYQQEETPQATVICTHNSRRSHMGQLWLNVAAAYYDLPDVETFSGGTAITAFNPRAVKALQDLGFHISTEDPTQDNPVYHVRWNDTMTPYPAFSKRYDDPPKPAENFAAIMVCTSADEGCPIVHGSDFRLALPFNDPKAFDDTPLAAAKYEERSRDIGRECLYVFSRIKNRNRATSFSVEKEKNTNMEDTMTKTLGIGSRVNHPAFGVGVVIGLYPAAYDICFVTYGIKEVGRNYQKLEIIEAIAAEEAVSFSAAEEALKNILNTWLGSAETVELGDKWLDGTMILQPKNSSLKSKEIPIDAFFHKIVMVRDRLRVMEQRINSSKLTDEEKVNLQQYITRIYGSLTSFNVLFRNKEQQFKGESSKNA